MGRRSEMSRLVAGLEASERARERLCAILLTLAGQWLVSDACERLKIGRTRFQDLRRRMLQAAVDALEFGRAGRPLRVERRRTSGSRALTEARHDLRLVRAALDLEHVGVGEKIRARKARALVAGGA